MGKLGKALGDAAVAGLAGSVTGGIGAAVSGGLGLISGLFGRDKDEEYRQWQERMMQQQFANEKEMMGLQYGYNEQMAEANQRRAQELWDYTNYENQRKHMEEAGLSIGLMYGQGGAGGATASGGQGSGVNNTGTNAVATGSQAAAAAMQAKMMGIQMKAIEADTAMKNASAYKMTAEAEKTSGVDTEKARKEIELNTILQRIKLNEEQITAANITTAVAESQQAMEALNQAMIKTEIDQKTKEAMIGKAFEEWSNAKKEGALMIAQKNLTEKQAENIKQIINNYAYEVATRRMTAEAARNAAAATADKVIKEYEVAGEKLKREDERILQQWILGGAGELAKLFEKFVPMNQAKQVIETVSETFKGPGGSKTYTRTTKN